MLGSSLAIYEFLGEIAWAAIFGFAVGVLQEKVEVLEKRKITAQP